MSDQNLPPGTSHAYRLGVRTLDRQYNRVDSLDTKAAVVMGVNGVLAGFILRSPLPIPPIWLAAVAGVSLLASLAFALFSFSTGKYASAPAFDAVLARVEASDDWLQWRFLPNIENAIQTNHDKLEQKARFLAWSIGWLIVQIPTLGGYLFYASYLSGTGS